MSAALQNICLLALYIVRSLLLFELSRDHLYYMMRLERKTMVFVGRVLSDWREMSLCIGSRVRRASRGAVSLCGAREGAGAR